MRFGTVAIIGRTNVGKSTFLNAALGEKLAIVSPQPQTTRDQLLGVLHRGDTQIAFSDTPGLHRPKTELGRRMNATALDTVKNHDVVLFVTDVSRAARVSAENWRPDLDPISPDDRQLLKVLRNDVPTILVLNKVDTLKDKTRLLPLIAKFNELHEFAATVPTSFLKEEFVNRVLDEIEKLLPQSGEGFDEDTLTDKPVTFFVREFVREQVLLQTRREVPHAVAVTVDRYEERPNGPSISATIHVEKAGQRSILVGKAGERIKALGIAARERLMEFLGTHVHLELFVRVTERWKDVPRQLKELGYDANSGRSLTSALPPISASKKRTTKPAHRETKKVTQKTPKKTSKQAPAEATRKSSKPKSRAKTTKGKDLAKQKTQKKPSASKRTGQSASAARKKSRKKSAAKRPRSSA